MDIIEKILKNKKYKEQIDRLDDETLVWIAKDRQKALETAQRGIAQQEPEKLNDIEYLEVVATGMQKLAQKILKEKQ
jgi:hypothetical protein